MKKANRREVQLNKPTNPSLAKQTAGESSHRPHGRVGRFPDKAKDELRTLDQAMLSGVEVEADTQLALQGAQEAAKRIHPLSGPAKRVVSVGQGAQADLHTAQGFQDTYLKPLKIFDTVIGEIANVCRSSSRSQPN
ncbi:hypothetical protein DFJ58DRAFT_846337 [Suillus subalutaceus]|uniref:uncharacterized protein n=1 Tax=Suillus subalutaceus TaxID=48586 RepID=UPI001B86FCF5|nr:uncharacterized protein DFJ58DRAFT_846337 [Suillus subalutaceus]KAG1837691.1 hypothetical protein DFJ58DRAFT_846337 [Suillus subalutaceus]